MKAKLLGGLLLCIGGCGAVEHVTACSVNSDREQAVRSAGATRCIAKTGDLVGHR
jgi:hypothetical protein